MAHTAAGHVARRTEEWKSSGARRGSARSEGVRVDVDDVITLGERMDWPQTGRRGKQYSGVQRDPPKLIPQPPNAEEPH